MEPSLHCGYWLLWMLEKPQCEQTPRKVAKPRHVAWVTLSLCLYDIWVSNMQPEGKKCTYVPGQVAQLVRALAQCAEVVGGIPGQGIYENQPMNA